MHGGAFVDDSIYVKKNAYVTDDLNVGGDLHITGSTYLEWRQSAVSYLEFPYITKKEMGNAIRAISEKFELVDKALVSKLVKEYVSE